MLRQKNGRSVYVQQLPSGNFQFQVHDIQSGEYLGSGVWSNWKAALREGKRLAKRKNR